MEIDSDNEEADAIVTLKDLEDDSEAENLIIYGGCDFETECSFTKGYLKRQALYVCATCTNMNDEPAAVCFHCSMQCHDGHDIIDIYTKRNFRCDCGNKKFKSKCTLWEEKDDTNELNEYGHNFQGHYCTCKKPHPEYEDDVREMFQCCLCEDWFHLEHVSLNSETISNENDEFTCPGCLKKNCFLLTYIFAQDCSSSHEKSKRPALECKLDQMLNNLDIEQANICWQDADYKTIFNVQSEDIPGKFWPVNWRESILCHCDNCANIYKTLHLDFLLDKEDTLQHYTEVAMKRIAENKSKNDEELNDAFNSLPRPVAIDLAHGINDFREAFQSLIREKENTGDNIIREADIKKIFENIVKNRVGKDKSS